MLQKYVRIILLNRWVAFSHDLLWVPLVLWLAFWFRFNLQIIPENNYQAFLYLIGLSIPIHTFLFWFFGLYRGVWRFASMRDLIRIVKAVTLGSMALTLAGVVTFHLQGVPRSVLLLSPLLLVIALIAPRLCYRIFKDRLLQPNKKEGRRTLIVGAGQAGERLLRDLIARQEYLPVALVDDNHATHGREIHGIRVLGSLNTISEIVNNLEVELVLFAIPSARKETVSWLVTECVKAGVECKTLPSIDEMTNNDIEAEQLRPFVLDDLLGRQTVKLDEKAISGFLKGKTILVTGGGGSIGSELCRQIAMHNPHMLIVFDNGEFNIYSIDHELRNTFPDVKIITVLGDVKNKDRVDWVFKKFTPHVIFHAAAYKHVPMIELNPAEGVHNNVMGTKIVADAADRFGTDVFVFVSTDKAVNPANVMGTTKRIAEIYCQNLAARSKTRFITTRFGNVLGSAGSVVHLFEKQIKDGGPVTITHRDITRYFMTIPEAVSLILQAGTMGEGGEIFVLDMGEPMLIRELAEQMIRLSGLIPHQDIDITYIGLRPGEKLYEEIFHERENLQGTKHPKLYLASSRKISWSWLEKELAELHKASQSRDVERLIHSLRQIVPEYDGVHLDDEKKPPKQTLRIVGNG